MTRQRPLLAAVLIFLLCGTIAAVFGRSALVAQDRVPEQYRVFAAALEAIETTYVGDAPGEDLVISALTGLMSQLDPHSNVMDPRTYAQNRERQEGRYYGIGVSIQAINGDIVVYKVFEESPAHESGLRRGDVIARVAGQDTKGWTVEQASAALKGPRRTSVEIAITRRGYADLLPVQVRRDEVHIAAVSAAIMLDNETGYVKLDEFRDNADREVGDALETLAKRGMTRLVFDLRGNPGGVLDQAILVASRFLPRGSLIVYTRGRVAGSAQDYRSTRSDGLTLPMITLVDRGSASASEIVSGALQDNDRSLVVGETTFGKALVQSVYRVSQGAGAAITTARYYTPSGRLIQRPWDGTFDEYLTYMSRDQDANKVHRPEDLKYTGAGRRVYSGGGIEPDRRLDGGIDGFNPTRLGRSLAARNLFAAYAQRFSRRGDRRIVETPPQDGTALDDNYVVDEAMLEGFKQLARSAGARFDESEWTQNSAFIAAKIRKEIDTDLFGEAAAYRNLAKEDPQLKFALTLFPEARELQALGTPAGRARPAL